MMCNSRPEPPPPSWKHGDKCDYAWVSADLIHKEVFIDATRPSVSKLRRLAEWIENVIKWMEAG